MCDTTSKQNLETIVEAIRHLEGDHLFSEEAGPHQVVKEEVVESCIIEDNGNVVEMTLPGSVFPSSAIINSLPQVPVPMTSSGGSVVTGSSQQQGSYQLTVSLPTVPVASMQNQTQQIQVGEGYILSKNYINISPLGACDCVQPGVVASTTTSGGILFTTGALIVIKTIYIQE